MQPSSSIVLKALALAAALTGGLYWLTPDLPWFVYAILFLIVGGIAHRQMLADAANKRIVDG